jgi:hopanoid biosynthesis associated radical SAM protein HpnJ
MKTLFLNPPSFEGFDGSAGSRYQACREVRSFWYPTWLAYPAGMIEGAKLLDASAEGRTREEVIREAAGYDLVVIHAGTPTFESDAELAGALKEAHLRLAVGMVGPHVTVCPEESIRSAPALDFVAVGEFDDAIVEISEGQPFEKVKGIVFRSDGVIRGTEPRPLIDDLDRLPFVTNVYARDLDIENYFIGYLRHPYMSLYAGRGCRGRCTYCLWPQTVGGGTYRVRSPGNILEELSSIKTLFPLVKEVFFDDDTFTDHPGLPEIANGMGRLGIPWSCNARANVPKKTLALLKDNGLRLLVVGYESGDQRILNNVRKGISVEGARKFSRAAKEAGVLVHGTFILGLPGETRETMEETMRFAREIDPYSLQVSLAAPYPGTALYQEAKREGWLLGEGIGLVRDGIQNSVLEYPWLSKEEIFAAVEVFYRRFYLRPGPILRILKEMLKDRGEFSRRIREGKEFFSFMAKRKAEIA